MPLSSYHLSDGSRLFTVGIQRVSTKRIYRDSLLLLANCLSLIYDDFSSPSAQESMPADLVPFSSMQHTNSSTRWSSLWTECQRWYNNRPAEVRQILDIRGPETEQIDPKTHSSFPILIYATPLALVSNTVYHITSLLLLIHKPRLLKPLGGTSRCYMSPTWHAQSIAGIATSNDYLEQWDPILVAGLLLTAKLMTHEAQQSVLLGLLERVTAMTGIKLDREIEALTSGWHISRYEEEIFAE
jgi:hypothetical protein